MAALVVGDVDVDDYGSIHDEELVVPLTLMEHNRNRTNTKHSISNPSWKTKKLMCAGIIGMCWSHSYFDSGDWHPCTPNGFGAGWAFDTPEDDTTNDEGGGHWTTDTTTLHDVAICGTP